MPLSVPPAVLYVGWMDRTAERRAARERRWQAKLHRRRRLGAVAVVAALAAVAGALVGSSAGGPEASAPASPTACQAPGQAGIAFAAGQSVAVRMEATAGAELRRQARRGEIGGVVLFPPPEVKSERLAAEIDRLQAAAAAGGQPPLLVAIDQEGGPVERIPALAPQASPFSIGANDDRASASLEGRATGFQLRELGIDVNLAPVLDVPASEQQFMAPRAFGFDPAQVTDLGLAFARAMRREAVAATAKHFPGLGRASENTDFAPTTVAVSRAALERDLEPFRAAVGAGIDLIMVSSAAYPGLGSRAPAVHSPEIVTGLLREELGFEGVIVSDDLLAPALTAGSSRREAAIDASRAGVDLLLFASKEVTGIADALATAVASGQLDERGLRASCDRVLSLKERLATGDPLSGA